MTDTITESQIKAAKVIGILYLFGQIPAIFAEFYVTSQIINFDSAAETAMNIVANERLFRLGIAANLVVWVLDVVLIAALYVVLKPVNRSLALLAAFWRIIETSTLIVVTLSDLDVLRILTSDYMQTFGAERLAALARLSIGSHSSAYNVGLVFLGLGSTVFCYLWLKSRLIPRALAAWGIFSSLLVGACAFVFIIFPELRNVINIAYFVPIFLFEVTIGLWLLLKGIRPSGPAADLEEQI